MKWIWAVSTFTFLLIYSHGQARKVNAGGIEMEFFAADTSFNDLFLKEGIPPEFPGGMLELVAFAKRKIKYPKTAIKDDAEGTVILAFEIDKNGKVVKEEIYKSARYDFDVVCLRMLKKMPDWVPGRLNGKPISVKEHWRIIFRFTD